MAGRYIDRKLSILLVTILTTLCVSAQINTDRMMVVGRNALYFEDYVLSIQYFNQIANAKPYMYEPYFYRAIAKLSLEDYRGAEEDCNSSIERNPFVVDSYQIRGLAKIYQGKYDQAIEDYYKGLSMDPENRTLRHNLVLCLMHQDYMDEARASADTLLRYSPRYTPAMSMMSEICFELSDTASATEWILKANEIDQYDASLRNSKAIHFVRLGKYEEAEADAEMAIYLEPNNSSFYINRAMIRYHRNNLRGALSDYDVALQIDPNSVIGYYNRGILRAQIGDDNNAITDFDFVIEREPDNLLAVFNRGLLREATGDLLGAEKDYSAVLLEYPQFIQGYQLRASVRERLGDYKGADQDNLVVLRDQNRRFNALNGNAEQQDDNDEDSTKTRKESDRNVRNYRKLVVADNLENATGFSSEYRGKVQNRNIDVQYLPLFQLTYFYAACMVDRMMYFSADVEELGKNSAFAGNLYINNDDISLNKAQIELLFKEVERLTRCMLEEPENAVYLLARALSYSMLQDYVSAESDCSKAVLLDESLWVSYFFRAIINEKISQLNANEQKYDNLVGVGMSEGMNNRQIINDLTHVIELKPDMAYAYYNRGTMYARTNDYPAAVVDFTKAIELNDEMAEAYYNRALVYVFQDRIDEAIKDLSKAGELGLYQAYNIIKRFSHTD